MGLEKIVIDTPVKIIEKPNKAIAGVNDAQPDLLYMDSVLVSTGENRNDDVFLPEEMWKARNTPRLKPIDWEHETGSEVTDEEFSRNPKKTVVGNQIVGVMYNTYAIDDKGTVIAEDNKDIPASFHIVDQGAIYKSLFPKTAAKIEKGAKEGTLFVSMEAWFDKFDYLVGNRIVARNEQTAFLDKSLRAAGGNGIFGEIPVKRVLRNLTFGGKGIVFRPANPNSVIMSVTNAPVQTRASQVYNEKAIASNIIGELNPDGTVSQKELSQMGDENKNFQPVAVLAGLTVEEYKTVVSKASQLEQTVKSKEAEIEKAKAALEEAVKVAEALKAAIVKGGEALEATLPGIKTKLAAAKPAEFFDVIVSEVSASKAKLEEVGKKLVEAESKLAQAAKDKQVAERRSKIAAELKVDGDKLEKLLVASKDLPDEAFASWLGSTKELVAGTQASEDAKKKEAELAAAKLKADKEAADKAAASSNSEGITDPKILEKIKSSAAAPAGVVNVNANVDLKAAYAGLASAVVGLRKSE